MIWYRKKQRTQEGGDNEENCEEMKQDPKMKDDDARKRNTKGRTHEGKENQNEEKNRKEKNERKKKEQWRTQDSAMTSNGVWLTETMICD